MVGYLKHFAGSDLVDGVADLSHRDRLSPARVMSLSVRLYANMFAGDLVTLVFFSLFRWAFR
jgi:F-type H+-transporting ATPase subunit a